MSQSKTSYGAELRKGTARSRRVEHDSQLEKSADSDTVEPACRAREIGRGAERRKWRETPYDSRIRAFYEPCEWCFSNGAPDDSEIETVVRSSREPTSYHRLRSSAESICQATGGDDRSDTDTDDIQIAEDPIKSLAELQDGQLVIWENRERPLRVIRTANRPDETITLQGPDGGEYQVEGRPERPRPYYLYGSGYLSEIIRVRVTIPVEAV